MNPKPTYVLGISCYYHDSSATLLKDGQIVSAAQEERFTRIKHDTSFPINAIAYCFESERITIKDVKHVAFYEKPFLKFERLLHQHLTTFPWGFQTFLQAMPSWVRYKLRVTKTIRKKLKFGGAIAFIPHHLAHAASTFLPSPFKDAAIVTADGVGEWATTTIGKGSGNSVELIHELQFPHSLGLLYSTITAYLGFSVNNSEYKVMGLSAYGNLDKDTNHYYRKLLSIFDIKNDGSYRLKLEFFKYHYSDRMPSLRLCQLLGGPVRKKESEITKRHKDIAAALQLVLEEVMNGLLEEAYRQTGCENVVLAGGVALNSVYNGKILKNTKFKNLWIQPDAGDGGTSMGAALYLYNCILNHKRNYVLENIYLGPSYSDAYIEHFLSESGIKYSKFKGQKDLSEKVAKLIFENKIIGWFQGRMEWGPRALGARSILANPTNTGMQNILNTKVKLREEFRPFAPVVPYEDANTYFICDKPIPDAADFMLMVYPAREKYKKIIPAVVHQDGTGRLQTVKKRLNPLYYQTIKEFEKLSGMPIIINTSLNVRGEPMVCSPEDAYRCMMGTEIDYMVMGHFLVGRSDNMKDAFDIRDSHEVMD